MQSIFVKIEFTSSATIWCDDLLLVGLSLFGVGVGIGIGIGFYLAIFHEFFVAKKHCVFSFDSDPDSDHRPR